MSRLARPREVGLLTAVDTGGRGPGLHRFPYAIGERIAGDLTVTGHLAVGRLGHLYQVWSAREWCAYTCKILSPSMQRDRRALAALRREGAILRGVRHPNLVRGYGVGEFDGLPFVLMEYLAGPSLFDLLESRPERRLGVADATRTAIHVAAGVHHLHGRGWLHLDLKPANLLFHGRVPVLVDFDAARPIRPRRRPQRPLGTAPYMAPEQVRLEALTPAADVYGLGAVLYEMLTGRWPFEAVYRGDEERVGIERRYPQLGAVPPPPPRHFNDDIPPSLERIVMRCLAREPSDRFPGMHPLLLALSSELDERASLWPGEVRIERRRALRPVPVTKERGDEAPERRVEAVLRDDGPPDGRVRAVRAAG